ncbi:MAG: molybdopterin-dependent oxidoreductase [Bacteroidetes bacterium]|nr:molybdopterin-dependent oxidoreductase [Bacteroidota bacterium]
MKNADLEKHVKGESLFVDDIPEPAGTLYAYVLDSPIAHGLIKSIDFGDIKSAEGFIDVLTWHDIEGENQVGGIIHDEVLLAEKEVHFIGEPIAVIVADSARNAKLIAKRISIEFEKLPVVLDPREAFSKKLLIKPPVIFQNGNVENAWKECSFIAEGTVESGGQEHLYLETQCALAVPKESDSIKIYSSTQGPTVVQRTAAKVLNLPMNKIEVDVLRLGGGFGGKEDQATHWAVLAALAARKTKRPVKLVLSRLQDLRVTGKRHPYSSDYKIGLTDDGKILAFQVTYFQDAGACADLSPAILERTLFHVANSYHIPNVLATGISCKTNITPNTAFRGFGGPQAMFVMESAIYNASVISGIPVKLIQKINLLDEGDEFHYGQIAENVNARKCWNYADEIYGFKKMESEVHKFNEDNKITKRGIAYMPVCFGISFTSTFLNQASALIHVYSDGSVGVSTAAIEMGQGVNAKIISIVSQTFSINSDKIRIESTNTTRIANTSATAASSGADLNGNAALIACKNILERLKKSAAEELSLNDYSSVSIKEGWIYNKDIKTDLSWELLVNKSYMKRINLSSHAFYATPQIYFDRTINKGRPFAYHVYGTAATVVELDCILGRYQVESVSIVHDYGKSLHHNVDVGQVEGGLLQGIGWMTLEEIKYSDSGDLLSNSLSTYKIPDIYSAPREVNIHFLKNSENPFGPLKSKAIGEPPLMYGIGTYFALLNAMRAFNPNVHYQISAPLTPEKVLLALYKK